MTAILFGLKAVGLAALAVAVLVLAGVALLNGLEVWHERKFQRGARP